MGANVKVQLEEDTEEYIISPGLIECLADEPSALQYFNSLLPSHQRYYSKWIDNAKTENTRIKRIAMTMNAMANRIGFAEMLKMAKEMKIKN